MQFTFETDGKQDLFQEGRHETLCDVLTNDVKETQRWKAWNNVWYFIFNQAVLDVAIVQDFTNETSYVRMATILFCEEHRVVSSLDQPACWQNAIDNNIDKRWV